MDSSVLLLDCSTNLAEQLHRSGFTVSSACIGYTQPRTELPAPIYEHEIIIYNPAHFEPSNSNFGPADNASDVNPQVSPLEVMLQAAYKSERNWSLMIGRYRDDIIRDFWPLKDHIQHGATLIVFINNLACDFQFLNDTYSWIPNMPQLAETRDSRIITIWDQVSHSEAKIPE